MRSWLPSFDALIAGVGFVVFEATFWLAAKYTGVPLALVLAVFPFAVFVEYTGRVVAKHRGVVLD